MKRYPTNPNLDLIVVDGIERSRVNADGNLIDPTDAGLVKFWRMFGDCKSVDSRGRPLPLHHGAPDVTDLLDSGMFKSQHERIGIGQKEQAHWFAASKRVADSYADDRRAFDYRNAVAGTITAYLLLKNPLIVDADGEKWRTAQRGRTEAIIAEAKAGGHDGIIIRNVRDNYQTGVVKGDQVTNTFTVFDRRQIKSVTNYGIWDANDPCFQPPRKMAPVLQEELDSLETQDAEETEGEDESCIPRG